MKLRILLILSCLLLSAASSFGQATPEKAPDVATEIRTGLTNGFNEVNGWVVTAAEGVPADKYSYRPVDTVRTFGQLIAHMTYSYNYFCTNASGTKFQWVEADEKALPTDKDKLLPKLKEAAAKCNAVYSSGNSQLRPLFINVNHTSLHYGNVITYMRMLGLKPPSS